MRWAAWEIAVGLSLVASSAKAQSQGLDPRDDAFFDAPPITERVHMHLDYRGAPGCSEAELFKDAVRVRQYRWDPFAPYSPWRLTIRVTRKGPGYDGSGELYAPNGTLRWRRTLRGPYERCYEIIAALALDVAIAIMPAPSPPAPPPPPAPEPPCPACPACPEPARPPPPERPPPPLETPEPKAVPRERPLAVRFGVAAWSEIVASGWGSLGLSADVGVRYRAVSLGVEAHGDPPLGSRLYQGYPVSIAKMSSMISLCAHWGWFAGCAVGDIGRMWFPERPTLLPTTILYGAVGARVGLEFPVVPPRFFLRAAVDLLAPIAPPTRSLMTGVVVDIAGPSVGLGLGALFELSP